MTQSCQAAIEGAAADAPLSCWIGMNDQVAFHKQSRNLRSHFLSEIDCLWLKELEARLTWSDGTSIDFYVSTHAILH